MKGLREKFRKNEGFTLVEMLIVVAIIAILIAVSIPMVGTALEGSRHAVDQANERDAISLASIIYLTDDDLFDGVTGDITLNYCVDDASHQGSIGGTTAVESKCTCGDTSKGGAGSDKYLTVTINKDTGKATTTWASTSSTNTWSEADGYKAGT